MSKTMVATFYLILVLFSFVATVFTTIHVLIKPSNDRDWSSDQAVLAYAEITDTTVAIHNIRNFTYASTTEYEIDYYDKTFVLDDIKNVYYIVEPFSGIPGSAHTFLSFEFAGNNFVAISVEIRKEKGETYHPIKGLFNQYELMYVIADERDAIKLRANYRKDSVYMYPVKTSKENKKKLFINMLSEANRLREKPEFYNTITNTCTTEIARQVNRISPERIPFFNIAILFPKNSDRLAHKLGLIDTELSFEEARARYNINERALKYADDLSFSVKIREES